MRRIFWRFIYRFAPPEMVTALKYRQIATSGKIGGFPPRNLTLVSAVPAGTILVLAPHPDDEIIGPGGTLLLHLENQDPVTVLYLTDGRGGIASDTSLVNIRRQEARTIGEKYGFKQIFWDIPDTTLKSNSETVRKLRQVLSDILPDFIYLPSFFDRQHDHFAANNLLAGALTDYNHSVAAIFGYEIWDNISYPNYIVDISNHFEKKAEMMQHYETPMQTTDFAALFRHRNALHYSLFVTSAYREPEGYAEAFYRLDTSQFLKLFKNYRDTLQKNHHPLVN